MKRKIAVLLGVILSFSVWASAKQLVPMGNAVGIKVSTEGVLVVGLTAEDEGGSPAAEAGLKKGDVITEINDIKIKDTQDVRDILCDYTHGGLVITATRDDRELEVTVEPKAQGECYLLGVWLRDSMAGIGTMTYYDPESGSFGALGHGINDVDTGILLPVDGGSIIETEVSGVEVGKTGVPGRLEGKFDDPVEIGSISANTDEGIFGELFDAPDYKPLEMAEIDEIKSGSAYILSNVQGDKVERFSVDISLRHNAGGSDGRDMMIKVTDEDLLKKTGGIVQGMSGSPIIQNGKLIGAVTHVLVRDPTKGYGIYIGNMVENNSF